MKILLTVTLFMILILSYLSYWLYEQVKEFLPEINKFKKECIENGWSLSNASATKDSHSLWFEKIIRWETIFTLEEIFICKF